VDQNSLPNEDLKKSHDSLQSLWSTGTGDYHSLFSAYLTANSIFIAALVALSIVISEDKAKLVYVLGFALLSIIGVAIAVQMALALGRFSAQNYFFEWKLRGIENHPEWSGTVLFRDLWAFREKRECLKDENNDPKCITPNWAIRNHRKKFARRSQMLPWLFFSVYILCLIVSAFMIYRITT